MKICVTGGAGYLGTALVQVLSQRSDVEEIVVYDNLTHGRRGFFLGASYGSAKIRFVRGDILDSRLLQSVISEMDVVFHLAAKVSTPYAVGDPHSFEQSNHWGSAELSYAIEESNVRHVVYMSSAAVYGFSDEDVDVDSPTRPQTWYGTSKWRGEKMFLRLSETRNVHVLRCANVYGYAPSIRFDAVINRFAWQAHFEGRLSIEGDGSQMRSFIHVDAAAQATAELLGGAVPSGVYNLVGFNVPIIGVAEALQIIYPKLERIFVELDMPRAGISVKKSDVLNVSKHDLQKDLQAFIERFAFSR